MFLEMVLATTFGVLIANSIPHWIASGEVESLAKLIKRFWVFFLLMFIFWITDQIDDYTLVSSLIVSAVAQVAWLIITWLYKRSEKIFAILNKKIF